MAARAMTALFYVSTLAPSAVPWCFAQTQAPPRKETQRGSQLNGPRAHSIATETASTADPSVQNPCDLNNDGVVDASDVQLATNMALGLSPCTASVLTDGICNVLLVQRIVYASLGGSCVLGVLHSVTLSWIASPSPNIAGYTVYRASVSGGPYTRVTTDLVADTSYFDIAVKTGATYCYVVTATDASAAESDYSNEACATVPSPYRNTEREP